MQVQFGNVSPRENGAPLDTGGAPAVTYANLHDLPYDETVDVAGVKTHLYEAITGRNGVTSLPGHEALLAVVHPDGIWATHSTDKPSWVWSDDETFAQLLGSFYGVPVGIPEGVEDTHHTLAGPPGVTPGAATDLTNNITQNGRDIVARALGGFQAGATGQATASSSTTLTTTTTAASTTQWNGQRVFATVSAAQLVWGVIQSCTSGANSVLTVDRWYAVGTPGGAAGTTPSSAASYVIADGNGPAWFVGLSASTTAPASPDTHTSLTSEIVTSGGGLVRQIAPFAHTASANTWTLTPVYTANGSDSLPVTIGSYGVFTSMVPGATTANMLYYNILSTTALLSLSGDQLTLTITVTTT